MAGLGQYDHEYQNCSCFWGTEPGKYVRLLSRCISRGVVLDLGAGEGKNAIYLASQGLTVVAVECSPFAIRNFAARLQTLPSQVQSRIEIVEADVLGYEPNGAFIAVIAYGLLHCLPDLQCVEAVIAKMKTATAEGGFNVAVAFNDDIPVPSVQNYLQATLLPIRLLEQQYVDWRIVASESERLQETHPTSNVPHEHSISRILAQKTK